MIWYEVLLRLCRILLQLCWMCYELDPLTVWPVNITSKRGVQEAGLWIQIWIHYIHLLCYFILLFHHVINSCTYFMVWIHTMYCMYWNHMCNSYMLFILIDSISYSFHTVVLTEPLACPPMILSPLWSVYSLKDRCWHPAMN
jgi:cellulose synthase/poly-beta-1,6-N-acetylglucosamine synthase-like glycosyltransferase